MHEILDALEIILRLETSNKIEVINNEIIVVLGNGMKAKIAVRKLV